MTTHHFVPTPVRLFLVLFALAVFAFAAVFWTKVLLSEAYTFSNLAGVVLGVTSFCVVFKVPGILKWAAGSWRTVTLPEKAPKAPPEPTIFTNR